MRRITVALAVLAGVFVPATAQAATALDGAQMGLGWALPFVGVLLSIATGPLLFPKIWHAHYGKIAGGWAALTVIGLAAFHGVPAAFAALVHAVLAEYVSFIVLLLALYVVAGGIHVGGSLRGTPWLNAGFLAFGTVIASVVGTTGAAMILVRPLIRANAGRTHNAHVVIFFIFLVANIGGALSPLGDPPLFVGFLRGVDFFWTTTHLAAQTGFTALLLLLVFLAVDFWLGGGGAGNRRTGTDPVRVHGLVNLPLIAAIIAAILLSAAWQPGISFDIAGTTVQLQNLVRDGALIVIALLSLWLTPEEHRAANDFTWEPIREVAKLFAGIFICIAPVLAMLDAGAAGPFAWLLRAVTTPNGAPHDLAYFWLTGALSAFLDNAPTYLVFFQLAGGDPVQLMGPLASTLAAISLGAVFMGALTYIGNAPNFMVYAIAQERGVNMPSFFGYMAWSCAVLLPVLALVGLVFM
jgi:Na+/H+ antiporter NhaD/arsenite permease-like protein